VRVYLLVMLIAGAGTYLLVPVVRRIAMATGAMTQVRARDIHRVPVARLGGVAMFAGLAVSFLISSQIPFLEREFAGSSAAWSILLGAGLMCLVGAVDDVWELDWYAKLAGEMLAAGVMVWQGVQLMTVPVGGLTVGSTRIAALLTVLLVVVVANAVNFIDGLDGLAAGVVAIASMAFFIYTYMLTRESTPGDFSSIACVVVAALVGICVGFLPHNFHPASIFMGDSGALMLGLVTAAAGILVTGQIDPATVETSRTIPAYMPIILPVAILIVPLVDFVWAVIRRTAQGKSPFSADSGHLHHRLLRLGHSHRGAVWIMWIWSGVFSFSAVAFAVFSLTFAILTLVIGLVLAVGFTAWELTARPLPALTRESSSAPRHEAKVSRG